MDSKQLYSISIPLRGRSHVPLPARTREVRHTVHSTSTSRYVLQPSREMKRPIY